MIVTDASVIAKWVLAGEKNQQEAIHLLEKHRKGEEKIIVPDLLFYELANVLATKTALTTRETTDSLRVIFQADLAIYQPNYEDILKATKQAKKYQTTVYDMLYAVTAKKHNTVLITADDNFVRKTRFRFVKLL